MKKKSKLKIIVTVVSYWIITNLLDLAIFSILGWWILAIIGVISLLLIIFSVPLFIFFLINHFPLTDFLYLFLGDIIASVFIFLIAKALLVDHIYKKGKHIVKKSTKKVKEIQKSR